MSLWCLVGALISFFGLIHSEKVGWLVGQDDISWRFAVAYLMVAVLSWIAHYQQKRGAIEPMRAEAVQEQMENDRKQVELEVNGGTSQPNACCSCI
jgi:hypothetical protein